MATLDPFRDLERLAERMFSGATEAAVDFSQAMRTMPIDLFRDGDHWVLMCDVPGVDPSSIEVNLDGRMLTLRATRTGRDSDVEWLRHERSTGHFARQLTIGSAVDAERIHADYADGVLTVTLPIVEAAKPRRIEIEHQPGAEVSA